jgi:hypothetical protein
MNTSGEARTHECTRANAGETGNLRWYPLWLCRNRNRQFTLKVNTIFEDSPTAKLRLVKQGGMHGGKTFVQGILDRNLRQVRAQVAPNVTRKTLQNVLLRTSSTERRSTPLTRSATTSIGIGQCPNLNSFPILVGHVVADTSDSHTGTLDTLAARHGRTCHRQSRHLEHSISESHNPERSKGSAHHR